MKLLEKLIIQNTECQYFATLIWEFLGKNHKKGIKKAQIVINEMGLII